MTSQQHLGTHTFQTPFGKIVALKENGILKAKSIRYARSERYQKPVPIESGQSDCIFPEKTPVCPQIIGPLVERMIGPTLIERFEVDESPQYLSVFRPESIAENENLPVVVWIHGGSHEIGCGDLPTSDPSVWVKEQNIIVVTVTFRLGLLGFLGDNKDRTPNLGLLDIIEALRWIHDHIAGLGGDPGNVTLLGQSSGGDAVAHLMISDGVEGLFQRVIIQSAPLGLRHSRQKMTEEFLRKTDHLKDEKDVLKIMNAYRHFVPSVMKYGLKAAMPFGIQYGFPPLCTEKESLEKWKQNAQNYDVLIGFNHDETSFYLKTSEKLKTCFRKGSGLKILNKLVKLSTAKIYRNPAGVFAKNYAEAKGNVYLFTLNSTLNNDLGASHCFDLPLIFENENAWKSAELLKNIPWKYIQENGKKLRSVWAEFSRTGNISYTNLPEILTIQKLDISHEFQHLI